MKRLIFILSLLAPILYVLINIAYFAGAIVVGEDLHTYNEVFSYSLWLPAIVAVGAWLFGVMETAQHGPWRWFAFVLLVPVIGSLVYSAVHLRAEREQVR